MLITRKDPFTGRINTLEIPCTPEQIYEWQHTHKSIQSVMPHLTPDQREFLMTGVTAESWAKYVTAPGEED